jgi:GNAT superfamily N-acetyltransferase
MKAVAASAEHEAGLLRLFQATESPCHCRYWHFTGDKNAWLDRCYNETAKSQDEMRAALQSGSDEMRGVVAVDDTAGVVGWMKLTPATSVQKLYDTRLYKGLPVLDRDPSGVFTVGCFLVLEEWRKRGVARALLEAGIAIAREAGAHAIEAFPRNAEGVGGEELWTGPKPLFDRAGFETVHDFAAYPVLRLAL